MVMAMGIRKMICIVCPKGCHMEIDEQALAVRGNSCVKGAEYAKNELTNPLRTLTSTVRITGGLHDRLPVRTKTAIPKEKLFDCMEVLHAYTAAAPVKNGQVLIRDICSTGADVVATRDMGSAHR